MSMNPQDLSERLSRLEVRVDQEIEEIRRELNAQGREVAIVRERGAIFEQLLIEAREVQERIAADVAAVRTLLLEHVAADGRDRVKMLIGVITAALSGIGTLAVLAWGIYGVVERLP